jgi:hypothetical protein
MHTPKEQKTGISKLHEFKDKLLQIHDVLHKHDHPEGRRHQVDGRDWNN